eukprot:18706-Pyramimonas_sp.AAC.1
MMVCELLSNSFQCSVGPSSKRSLLADWRLVKIIPRATPKIFFRLSNSSHVRVNVKDSGAIHYRTIYSDNHTVQQGVEDKALRDTDNRLNKKVTPAKARYVVPYITGLGVNNQMWDFEAAALFAKASGRVLCLAPFLRFYLSVGGAPTIPFKSVDGGTLTRPFPAVVYNTYLPSVHAFFAGNV